MSDDEGIWLGLNGQKYGPYPEATVRAWRDEGKLAAGTLGWRGGLSEWLPIDTLLPRTANGGWQQPGFDAPPPGLSPNAAIPAMPVADAVPVAPSLHWGWTLLLSIVTFGLFTLIWIFVQSSWVKKIDPRSKATIYFVVGLACAFGAGGIRSSSTGMSALLQIAQTVFVLMGYFSMSASLKRFGVQRGIPVEIGGITLFFFTLFYFQGQLTRIARWQTTGVLEDAPKGILWAVIGGLYVLFLLAIFLALVALGSSLH